MYEFAVYTSNNHFAKILVYKRKYTVNANRVQCLCLFVDRYLIKLNLSACEMKEGEFW